MRESDELYVLVKSLTKAERRFFRLYAEGFGGRGPKSYLQLFDLISAHQPYDAAKLAAQIDAQGLRKQLPSIKNRLFNHILRSQRMLKAGQTCDSQLRVLLEEVELLYFQRLYKSAQKRIRQGLELAQTSEKHAYASEFLRWKQKLLSRMKLSEQEAKLHEIREAAQNCASALAQTATLTYLHEHMRILARLQPRGENPETLQPHREILQQPLLQEIPEGATDLDRVLCHDTHGIFHVCNGDYGQAYRTFKEMMAIWDARTDLILTYPERYLRCYNNYLGALLYGEQHWEEFLSAVRRLHVLPGLPNPVRINFQWVAYHQELVFSMHFRAFDDTVALIAEIETWIMANERKIEVPRLLVFFYNICMFYFVYGEFSSANRWLNRILHAPGSTERKDIRAFARIFQVLLQYELGNHDLAEHLVRAALRFMKKRKRVAVFERKLLDLVRQLSDAPDQRKQLEAFGDFKAALAGMAKGKTQRATLGLGELQVWVESKLKQQPIRRYFEEMLQSNREAAKMKS